MTRVLATLVLLLIATPACAWIAPADKTSVLNAIDAAKATLNGSGTLTSGERDPILTDLDAARSKVVALPTTPPLTAADLTSGYEGGNATNFAVPSTNTVTFDGEADPVNPWTTPFDYTVTRNALGRSLTHTGRFKYGAVAMFGATPSWLSTVWTPWWQDCAQNPASPWQRVNTGHTWDATNQILTFVTPTATCDTIRVAEFPPYTNADFVRDMDRWLATGKVTATQIGLSVQNRNLYRLTVNDTAQTGAKKPIYVVCGQHPQERFGFSICQGGLDGLLSGAAWAQAMLSRTIVHIVVVANPDCLAMGCMRSNMAGLHMNRWATSGGANLTTEGPEQYAIHRDIETLMAAGPALRLYFDIHTAPAWLNNSSAALAVQGNTALSSMTFNTTSDPTGLLSTATPIENYTTLNDGGTPARGHSPRVITAQFGIPTGMLDSAGNYHNNNQVVTPTSARALGIVLLRGIDAWLGTQP